MKALSRAEVASLAESVEALLAAIDAGELAASAATRHRVEGAAVALAAVQGRRSDLLADLTGPDSDPST